MAVAELRNPKTHYGPSDDFSRDPAGKFSLLAAEAQWVVGFDSPDLASAWGEGRFNQIEPVLDARHLTSYSYAGGNPISFYDPTGTVIKGTATGLQLARKGMTFDWQINTGALLGGDYLMQFVAWETRWFDGSNKSIDADIGTYFEAWQFSGNNRYGDAQAFNLHFDKHPNARTIVHSRFNVFFKAPLVGRIPARGIGDAAILDSTRHGSTTITSTTAPLFGVTPNLPLARETEAYIFSLVTTKYADTDYRFQFESRLGPNLDGLPTRRDREVSASGGKDLDSKERRRAGAGDFLSDFAEFQRPQFKKVEDFEALVKKLERLADEKNGKP